MGEPASGGCICDIGDMGGAIICCGRNMPCCWESGYCGWTNMPGCDMKGYPCGMGCPCIMFIGIWLPIWATIWGMPKLAGLRPCWLTNPTNCATR